MTQRTRKTIVVALLAVLGIAALAVSISWMSGCATKPAPTEPPPESTVKECVSQIQQMQGAVSIAKIAASVLVAKAPQYGPPTKIALAAIDAALANAKAQCDSGSIDGWTVALAAFDAAFAKLAETGGNVLVASADDVPPYAYSLEEFNSFVFDPETASASKEHR